MVSVEQRLEEDGDHNAEQLALPGVPELHGERLDSEDLAGYLGGGYESYVKEYVVIKLEAHSGWPHRGEGSDAGLDSGNLSCYHAEEEGHELHREEAADDVVEVPPLQVLVLARYLYASLPSVDLECELDDEARKPDIDEEGYTALHGGFLGLGVVVDDGDDYEEHPVDVVRHRRPKGGGANLFLHLAA